MTTDPLQEVYRVKDELARESGYDVDLFFQQLELWIRESPAAKGFRVLTPEDLQKLKSESEVVHTAK